LRDWLRKLRPEPMMMAIDLMHQSGKEFDQLLWNDGDRLPPLVIDLPASCEAPAEAEKGTLFRVFLIAVQVRFLFPLFLAWLTS